MLKLEEACRSLAGEGWQIKLDYLLKMDICVSPRGVELETVVVETLKKHLSSDGAYKFSDIIRAQAKEACNWIDDSNIMLMFVKSALICGYGVPTLEDYVWKGNSMIDKKKRLGENMVSI